MVRMSMFTALLVLVMTLQHGEASAAAAIAVNSSTGAWGEAHNYPSPGSAMREALRKCGPGCTVPKTFLEHLHVVCRRHGARQALLELVDQAERRAGDGRGYSRMPSRRR